MVRGRKRGWGGRVLEGAEIEMKIASYTARHTWAMVQKEDLLNPPAMNSEGLGHKNTDTTLAYLKSFKNEALDEMNKGIL